MQALIKLAQAAFVIGVTTAAVMDEGPKMFGGALIVSIIMCWVLTAFFSSLPGWLRRTFGRRSFAHVGQAGSQPEGRGNAQAFVSQAAEQGSRLPIREDIRKLG